MTLHAKTTRTIPSLVLASVVSLSVLLTCNGDGNLPSRLFTASSSSVFSRIRFMFFLLVHSGLNAVLNTDSPQFQDDALLCLGPGWGFPQLIDCLQVSRTKQ